MTLRAGIFSLRFADACCLALLLTLAWGPHWPFSSIGLPAPPAGLLNTGFDLADLLLVGILVGWVGALLTGRDRVMLQPRWVSGALLVFTLASGLAIFSAADRAAAMHFAVRSGGLTALYLYLYRALAAGRLTAPTLARWLAPGLCLNGLLAGAQAIHQNPLGWRWLYEPTMLRATSGTAVVLVQGTRILRPYGVLPHPNVMGGLLAAGLPLMFGLLTAAERPGGTLQARGKRLGAALRRTLVPLSITLIAAGVLLSLSRSAWLGLAAGGIYLVLQRTADRGRIVGRTLLAGLAIALALAVLLPAEWEAVSVRLQPNSNRLEETSIVERISLLELSVKVIAWRPLTGVGGNNFALAAGRFLPSQAGVQTSSLPVHNTYLLAQAELGPLGAIPWLILMLAPLLSLAARRWRPRTTSPPGAIRAAPLARLRRASWSDRGPGQRNHSASLSDIALQSGIGPAQTPDLRWVVARPRALVLPRWQALAACSLLVVAVVGTLDFYIWVNEPIAVLWIVALALFTASGTLAGAVA